MTERRHIDDLSAFHRTLLDAMPDGVSLADEDGAIIYANPAEHRMFGCRSGELVGRNVAEQSAGPSRWNREAPADVASQLEEKGVWCGEQVCRKRDGTTFHASIRIVPVEIEGRRHRLCVRQDITERKREQMALAASQARLRHAQKAGGIGDWEWDLETGRMRWSENLFDMLGIEPGRSSPSLATLERLIHPEDVSRTFADLAAARRGEMPLDTEFRIVRPDGRVRRFSSRGEIERDRQGRPSRLVGITFDVTERKAAEDALRINEERFRVALKSAPISMSVVDRDLRYVWIYQSHHRHALPTDHLIGRRLEEVYSLPGVAELVATKREVLADGRGRRRELEFIIDGQRYVYDIIFEPLVDPFGEIAGVTSAAMDVTERKRVEEALRGSEERFRALVTASASIVLRVTGKGEPLEAAGWPEYTGQGFDRRTQNWLDMAHPEDRPAVVELWRRAVATREPVELTHRLHHVSGDYRWVQMRGVPLKDADGHVREWVGMVVDIHERRIAETALSESEQRVRLAQDAAELGLWDWDIRRNRVIWSEGFYRNWGLDPARVTPAYQTFLAHVHPDDRARVHAEIQAALRGEQPLYSSEYRVPQPDGSIRWIAARGEVIRDEAGRPARMLGVNQNITERKHAEEQQRLLLAELNHRVKNVLATVQSIAVQTLSSALSLEDFRQNFEARLMALAKTHDILTQGNWENVALRDILDAELAPYRDGSSWRIALEGPDVRLGPRSALTMGMVFHELATNAAKYGGLSHAAGCVEVTWRISPECGSRLSLEWRERGGAAVTPPARRGFGSRLIERSVAGELGGKVHLDFAPKGVMCTIDIPLRGLQ